MVRQRPQFNQPSPDASIPRETFLARLKTYHGRLKEQLPDACAPETGGREYAREYTSTVDAVVELVFERAALEHDTVPSAADVAVIGMGGYGRRELAPLSDIDILILCKRKTKLAKLIAGSFIRLMWDVGFEIGHSMQSLLESEGVLSRNMDAKTALIESRFVCGSTEIARAVGKQISRVRSTDRTRFLRRKIKDAVARHKKFGSSYELIEPNVKLSPGGLRDYQTLVWLGMVLHGRGAAGLAALRALKLLHRGEARALQGAYDFLLKVRVQLHLLTRSRQDHLTVRMQRLVADRLHYGSVGSHLGVELFMKDYYVHTRTIFHIVEDIIDELSRGKDVGKLLGQDTPARSGRVLSMRLQRGTIAENPLAVFERQKRAGRKLDRALERRLAEMLKTELSGESHTERMRARFLWFLSDDDNVSLVLRSMHETGFLGRIIPEYARLTCLKRHDLYHHYTVDEHSFRVIRNLEELAERRRGSVNPFARLYSEIPGKRLLYAAALLHDIGKIEGRGHAKRGATLSRSIMKRLGATRDETEFVAFLIEHHLLMSHFSQRRDTSDEGTLQSFCAKVKTRTALKYLCLLTYADLKATSPTAWTRWKENLLWGLYLKAGHFIARKQKKPDEAYKSRKRRLLRAFPAGRERDRALAHLDLLPGRYLLTMNASQVKQHMALIGNLDGTKGVTALKQGRLFSEATFCTYDKPFRLSQLCGLLTVNDFNILSALAFTRRDGTVIDIFQVQDILADAPPHGDRLAALQESLGNVVEGREDINSTFKRHVVKWKRKKNADIPVSLEIEFESDVSADFTIIDVFAQDEPGLLYRITRALSEAGLIIFRARISTEANRAIDSFYVQDKEGNKVRSAQFIEKIRDTLREALTMPHDK
jgi:[protein-PII] uridylyltransferase